MQFAMSQSGTPPQLRGSGKLPHVIKKRLYLMPTKMIYQQVSLHNQSAAFWHDVLFSPPSHLISYADSVRY